MNKVELEKMEAALKAIITDSQKLAHVVRDNDGKLQFYSNDDVLTQDTTKITSEQLADVNETLETILNLEKGFEASREGIAGNWVTKPLDP